MSTSIDSERLESLIGEASLSGGCELANYQLFVVGLCEALSLERPNMAQDHVELNDYVFERRVDFLHLDGSRSPGRIDCYKRGSFVLEAKQSVRRKHQSKAASPGNPWKSQTWKRRSSHIRRDSQSWDHWMIEARAQAENYARALPVDHGYPPFLLVVDVGNVIEIYADFSGLGKNYVHFPDTASYRIGMEDLRTSEVQERLRAIWNDPQSLDPNRHSALVTRDIAERLGSIASRLEARHDPQHVAEFLMRCFFTMFAEDVGLLPDKSFHDHLGKLRETPEHFVTSLEGLWRIMDVGGYTPHLNATLMRFNGSLFKSRRALPLDRDEITELWMASEKNWSEVEPAIFGTLLERALDPKLRGKLGAHYTPRAYVERLVVPTIIEPLRHDWNLTKTLVKELQEKGDDEGAIRAVRSFHRVLCTSRVLDPACGTGNFLYVSLELMKRLEGEVLVALEELGDDQKRFAMAGETVGPDQFYGLEINKRAVPIAEMVLWIGFLKWQLKTLGLPAISEPILHSYGTIKHQDAILASDTPIMCRDSNGRLLSRWDGVTTKPHPLTGELVPDADALVEICHYPNPRRADWPEVEFIVGNPPFIGGKDMRREFGDGYAEACWRVRPHVPGGADFVMHFWDEAAWRLLRPSTADKPNPLRRFGFITTNSITQIFSRRVMERHLTGPEPLSLVMAIPNHPWLKAVDKASVRIAMTVAERGDRNGVLAQVVSEEKLDTDTPEVDLERREGKIQSRLALGARLSQTSPLKSNLMLASRGVSLHGSGFLLTPRKAEELGYGRVDGLDRHVLDYRNGRDLAQHSRDLKVIDLYPLLADDVLKRFPAVYQHLLETVKPERDSNNMKFRREMWWWFGATHKDLRAFLQDLPRYIATVETSRHRTFQFLDAAIRPDNKLVAIGLDSAAHLAVLSSRVHVHWSIEKGGWMGAGNNPVYAKSETFDPFPFPQCASWPQLHTGSLRAQHDRLRELRTRLDQFRKDRQAEHPDLTMTKMYNVLERLRALENGCDVPALLPAERVIHQTGLISILKEIHDDIDRAVLTAYGWEDLVDFLVGRPGATMPHATKKAPHAEAEQQMLERLVSLNQERHRSEERGDVWWLRPDFQRPKLVQMDGLPDAAPRDPSRPTLERRVNWPNDEFQQLRIISDVLAKAATPTSADAIWTVFDGRNTAKRKDRVQQVLDLLVGTGFARIREDGNKPRYFLPR